MNAEAGLTQSPFRLAVERVAKSHPLMKWQEVHRRARAEMPKEEPPAETLSQVVAREIAQAELF